MVFWHPRGWTLYRLLEDAARAHVLAGGYREVRDSAAGAPPGVGGAAATGASSHDAMFACGEGAGEAALKPVSCPGHIQIVKRMAPSWRDLPIRIAEIGLVHRDEPGGTLHGLMRLRQFTQDDGHIFCSEDAGRGRGRAVLPRAAGVLSPVRLRRRLARAVAAAGATGSATTRSGIARSAMLARRRRRLGLPYRRAARRGRDLRAEARVRAPRSARARRGSAAPSSSTS